jgi:hypothetical protein
MAIHILIEGKPAVYASDKNLGQYGRAGHPDLQKDQVDVMTFLDGGHRNRPGLEANAFQWTGLFEASEAGTGGSSYDAIKELFGDGTGAAAGHVVSYYPQSTAAGEPVDAAAPGIGFDKARAFNITESGGVGDVLELSADIEQDGTADHTNLIVGTTVTANFTSTNIDLTASSTAGGRFYLHTLNNLAVGGNAQWTFTVQHASATGASWVTATGATGTYGSGTTTGVVLTSSGQLRRFVRVVATRDATTGTFEFVVGAKRV